MQSQNIPFDLTLVFRTIHLPTPLPPISIQPYMQMIGGLIHALSQYMFSNSIDSKVNKIKLNVDSYLNDRKKEGAVSQPVPSVRRPEQTATIPLPSLTAQNSTTSNVAPVAPTTSQFKPMDIQIRQLVFQGKMYDKQPLSLKNIIKEKSITIFYVEQNVRYKLEIRAVDNMVELRISPERGTVQISFKKSIKYKFFKQENGEPKWMLTNEIKDDKLTLTTNKDAKTLKNYFEGIVTEENIKIDSPNPQIEDKALGDATEREDAVDADEIVNFAMPTPQQLADTQKFRKAIKDMKEEEKVMILMDIFKIKKEYDDGVALERKKLKCPIHACQKTYREISQLKTHLKKHPELNKHGIEFTEFGTFEYSNKAMDLALYLGKLYPFELKKIIKKMKTKQSTAE